MAGGSHLKRLKASLRDQGITGPQKSKKEKKQARTGNGDKRLNKKEALSQIREQFNPFDLKHAKAPKFEVTTNRPQNGNGPRITGRPTAANSASEERRRETILAEYQNRNKVGGIIDRRFGEHDPTMTEETRAMERFAAEKQRRHKKSSLFDLEEPDGLSEPLTHMGQALTFDEDAADDFDEEDLREDYDDDASDISDRQRQHLKRLRDVDENDGVESQPERKKTKKEIYEEIIAKSKTGKYERQVAKDEDEDLRMQIDKELPDLRQLLSGRNKNDDQNDEKPAKLVAGVDQATFNQDFDRRLKQLVLDRRSRPTERTKTDEEKAEEAATKLRELEEKRQKRMRGETVSSSEDSDDEQEEDGDKESKPAPAYEFIPEEEDVDFGLGKGIQSKSGNKHRPTATDLGFDDEDDFEIDDELVASGSDLELLSDDDEDLEDEEDDDEDSASEESEDEFTKGILNKEEMESSRFKASSGAKDASELPYDWPCPQSLAELKKTIGPYPLEKVPVIIQRIRALYHPKLDSKHKEKLDAFSQAMVDLVADSLEDYQGQPQRFLVLEQVVRHLHSMSKQSDDLTKSIAKQFRVHLEDIGEARSLAMTTGDLVLCQSIGVIFSASDHFHPVVTPAILTMARQLGNKIPQSFQDHARGTFISTLIISWSQLSKRYSPEAINAVLQTLCALAPEAPASSWPGSFPVHESTIRISGNVSKATPRKLKISDCETTHHGTRTKAEENELAVSLISTACDLLEVAASTWSKQPAFQETFEPAVGILKHISSTAKPKPNKKSSSSSSSTLPASLLERISRCQTHLTHALRAARLSRRPLELHHHRPLAIKAAVPKFEDSFDPHKHYDPDRERAELAKLRAEHKKERKAAMREVRKDARFMAREKLQAKKAKDEAYEKKYKRLVAEIQNEEGREANAYERERDGRKKARSR